RRRRLGPGDCLRSHSQRRQRPRRRKSHCPRIGGLSLRVLPSRRARTRARQCRPVKAPMAERDAHHAVFLGPTLRVDEAEKILPAQYFPPAKFSDVLSLVENDPDLMSIVLIDGCLGDAQQVMHKEILYALERGIPVYG